MAVDAVSLEGVLRRRVRPAKNVLAMGDRFQVCGVDAESYAAQVVKGYTIDQRPMLLFPCPTVSTRRPATARKSEVAVETAVATAYGASPDPTSSEKRCKLGHNSILVNLLPEALVRFAIGGHREDCNRMVVSP